MIETEVKKEVDEAVKKARNDPEIPLEELSADVYSVPIDNEIRGVSPWDTLTHKRIGVATNQP